MPAGDDNLSSSKHTKDASIFMMVKTGWTRFLLLLLCLCKEISQKWQRGLSFIFLSEKKYSYSLLSLTLKCSLLWNYSQYGFVLQESLHNPKLDCPVAAAALCDQGDIWLTCRIED